MQVIGFTGLKGSGKSTAAKALFANSIEVNFADALKEMFDKLAPFKAIYGDTEVKDTTNIQNTNATVRKALQVVGIALRELDPDFWVKVWRNKIEFLKKEYPLNPKVYKYWTVADVRFENEAKAIQEMGGCIIRVVRRINDTPFDAHISEYGIPDNYVDKIIVNDGTVIDLHKRVREAVNG